LAARDQIEKKYSEILELAKAFDSCLEVKKDGAWGSTTQVKSDKTADYWTKREELESQISSWMGTIRKAISGLPVNVRKFYREQGTDPNTGEEWSALRYDNSDYESIVGFFEGIRTATEGSRGVLTLIKDPHPVFEVLRAIRGIVLSSSRTLEVLVPEIMLSIETQVKVVFRLREKGLTDEASMIEEIDQLEEKDNVKKVRNARTAVEHLVEAYCKGKQIEVKNGFYVNFDNAINAGLTDKKQRDSIAGLYSFASKIVHGQLESNTKNTQYAVNGFINVLDSLL
jgi:hypothetical protein